MPVFSWNELVTSMMVLIAFPVLAAALLALEIDWKLGTHVFDASSGGAILWQHLFWFVGHPEVYRARVLPQAAVRLQGHS